VGLAYLSHTITQPLESDPVILSGKCGLMQFDLQATSSSDPKPEGGCVSCVGNKMYLNPESGVDCPVGTSTEGAVEPLDSTGVKIPVGTSTEGAVVNKAEALSLPKYLIFHKNHGK